MYSMKSRSAENYRENKSHPIWFKVTCEWNISRSPFTSSPELGQRYTDNNNITHFPKLLVEVLSAWIQEADTNNLVVAERLLDSFAWSAPWKWMKSYFLKICSQVHQQRNKPR